MEKVKVTSLNIIVTGKKEAPYFQLRYREAGKKYYKIGYGSYNLDFVFGWRDECFEIVKPKKNIFAKLFGI